MPREEAGTEPGLLREQSQIPRNKKGASLGADAEVGSAYLVSALYQVRHQAPTTHRHGSRTERGRTPPEEAHRSTGQAPVNGRGELARACVNEEAELSTLCWPGASPTRGLSFPLVPEEVG